MDKLSREQTAFAVALLTKCMESREKTQAELERDTKVGQSTISKILKGDVTPSAEQLELLFDGLGLKLANVLADCDKDDEEIQGYLATPLTGLSANADTEVRRVVEVIKRVATHASLGDLPFELYWPGDHTHPKSHPNIKSKNVYLVDRSRASTYDFILLFCASPSFGVGQENEIAAQACTPAIRLIPENGLSRMMLGSFLNAIDVPYRGTLDSGITLVESLLEEALKNVRVSYYRQKPLENGVDMSNFGDRLRDLITSRCGGNGAHFAQDVGISNDYLEALKREPFAVTNPSARLLGRMAVRLSVKIAYLLGESDDCDPAWVESNATWRQWVLETTGLDAKRTLQVKDAWRKSYRENLRTDTPTSVSYRQKHTPMSLMDWDKAYKKILNVKSKNTSGDLPF